MQTSVIDSENEEIEMARTLNRLIALFDPYKDIFASNPQAKVEALKAL